MAGYSSPYACRRAGAGNDLASYRDRWHSLDCGTSRILDMVIDRIAWMAEREAHPRIIAALEAQAKAKMATETARAETDALRVTAETARAEIDALRASHSWRITAPLRSLNDAIRRRHRTSAG